MIYFDFGSIVAPRSEVKPEMNRVGKKLQAFVPELSGPFLRIVAGLQGWDMACMVLNLSLHAFSYCLAWNES